MSDEHIENEKLKSKFRHLIHNLFADQNRKSNVENRNFENMICNSNIKATISRFSIYKTQRIKVKKGRRADKEDRRRQKRKIIGKRGETKKKQKRRTKKRKKLCSTSPPGGNQVDG